MPVRPHARVWDHVVAELELPTDAQSGEALNGVPLSRTSGRTLPTEPIRGLWPRPVLLAVAAAIVGVLVGTGATLALTQSSTPPTASPTSTPNLVQTTLKPLDTPTAHGTAVLSLGTDRRSLTVRIVGLPEVPDGFYEVWLMNANPQRLLSLGVLDASASGVFQVPAGLDLSKYPVVDVSLQPFNGSPEHSGTSAVRGSFKT
ncbi:MAG: anti-sigma factor [Candidatus Nanopelagicales bacterium]